MDGFNGDSADKKKYEEYQEHVAMLIRPGMVLFVSTSAKHASQNQVDREHPFISEFIKDPSKEKNALLTWLTGSI
jgi:hypothetical protein